MNGREHTAPAPLTSAAGARCDSFPRIAVAACPLGRVGPSPLRRADLLVPREQVMDDHGAQVLSVEVRNGVEGLFGRLDLLQLPPQA